MLTRPRIALVAPACAALAALALGACAHPTTAAFSDAVTVDTAVNTAYAPEPINALAATDMHLATGTITLTWEHERSPQEHYEIRQAGEDTARYTTTEPSIDITVESGHTYTYFVVASNGFDAEPIALTTTPSTQPEFQSLTGRDTSTVTAEWSPVRGATSYRLDLTTDPNFVNDVTSYTAEEPSTTLTGLNSATRYYARVQALAPGGVTSPESEARSALTAGQILTVPSAGGSARRIVHDRDGDYLYVSDDRDGGVHRFDLAAEDGAHRLIDVSGVVRLDVHQATGDAYLLRNGSGLAVIERGSTRVDRAINISGARSVVVNQDTGDAYVWTTASPAGIAVVPRGASAPVRRVSAPLAGSLGAGLAISDDGRYVLQVTYATGSDHHDAVVIYDMVNGTSSALNLAAHGITHTYFAAWVPGTGERPGRFWVTNWNGVPSGKGKVAFVNPVDGTAEAAFDIADVAGREEMASPTYNPVDGNVYLTYGTDLAVVDPDNQTRTELVAASISVMHATVDLTTGRLWAVRNGTDPMEVVQIPMHAWEA